MYATAAQYNRPPRYPVTQVCQGIDGAPEGTDILGRIFAGVVSYRGNKTCYDTNAYSTPSETSIGWQWQVITFIIISSSDFRTCSSKWDFCLIFADNY